MKVWHVNLLVSYKEDTNKKLNRERIDTLLLHLGWLYGLELATSLDLQYESEKLPLLAPKPLDVFHFRSTAHSEISARDFRGILNALFVDMQNLLLGVLHCVVEYQKAHKRLPQPNSWRFLGYSF
ncbi:hypothetical protein PG279_04650 [Riemerella anatipestifer]|nr:hypothetical protein [Riemerella anatipestifer]